MANLYAIITVEDRDAGARLDVFLAQQPEIRSRSFAQRLIAAGKVRVDGVLARKNSRVALGQKIYIPIVALTPPSVEPEPIPLDIIYEDEDLIVVSKPAGMVTHPAAGNYSGTLVNALLAHTHLANAGAPLRPGIVHRLDKNTSGLIAAAKSDNTYLSLVKQLKKRQVKRYYQALVVGGFKELSGEIIAPIGRSQTNRQKMAVLPIKGRKAVTRFKVIKQFSGFALVEVSLETGRTHQIRVHMRFINHPVVGDAIYGGGKYGRNLGISRQFLHAWKLEFVHPQTNKRLSFTSPLPKDLADALFILEKREKIFDKQIN